MMTELFRNLLTEELSHLSIKLDENQTEQFYTYFDMLVEWNKFTNLTTITEMQDVITKHFADSLSLIKGAEDIGEKEYKIIDIGTGAGFPGIPLKIAFPHLKITLMDSLNKRVKFLNESIQKLGLKEIEAIHGRAEDLGRQEDRREKYDLCVSRAVANLSTLSEYCLPFVKLDGRFISYKSGKIEVELNQAKHALFLLGGKLQKVETFLLPGTDAERTLVIIKKIEHISKRYPRKAGLPLKEPLK